MGDKDHAVTLYSGQTEKVVEILNRDGVCFSKKEYVIKKYEESAPIFVAAYHWFITEAEKLVPKPTGAEYPYWAFGDVNCVENSSHSGMLRLRVPADEAIFFDMFDWNKIIRLQYIGETDEKEMEFRHTLADYGIRRESDIILTHFYPDLKHQVMDSWKRLFRHHKKIVTGDVSDVKSLQAGLWQLKKEWVL